MTPTTSRRCSVADLDAPARQGKKGISRFVSVNAAPAPVPCGPAATSRRSDTRPHRGNRAGGAHDVADQVSRQPVEPKPRRPGPPAPPEPVPGRDLAGAVGGQRVQPAREPRFSPAIGTQGQEPDRDWRCLPVLPADHHSRRWRPSGRTSSSTTGSVSSPPRTTRSWRSSGPGRRPRR